MIEIPGYAPEAEDGLLCSIFQRPSLLDELEVSAEWFLPSNQPIFRAAVANRDALDLVRLAAALRTSGELDSIGGAPRLSAIYGISATAENARYFLKIVREHYFQRELTRICAEREVSATFGDHLTTLEQNLTDLLRKFHREGTDRQQTFRETLLQTVDAIEASHLNKGRLSGIPTGLPRLDRLTGGLQPSASIVVAARPGEGKTDFLIHLVLSAAGNGRAVGVFSLEMSTIELNKRLLSHEAGIDSNCLRDGQLTNGDFTRLAAATKSLVDKPIHIDDRSALSIAQIASKARQWKRRHNIELIAIDYLQLARSTSKRAQDNRQIEISEISAGCKALSKELSIPVVVLAQINRDAEKGKRRRPRLADLRESGAIEQDADVVMFLHRDADDEEATNSVSRDDEEATNSVSRDVTLIVAKHRNGALADIKLKFECDVHTFRESGTQ